MLEVQARRSQLKKECWRCCCTFFSKGKAAELEFLDDVLEHYNRVESKDIKASILYILDTTAAETNLKNFGDETKKLANKLAGVQVSFTSIQTEDDPLLQKSAQRAKK